VSPPLPYLHKLSSGETKLLCPTAQVKKRVKGIIINLLDCGWTNGGSLESTNEQQTTGMSEERTNNTQRESEGTLKEAK